MDKNIITSNFSRNAASYDKHAGIQKTCAEKLIRLIGGRTFSRILEIGCGTGVYTRMLRKEYNASEITAVDISKEMVDAACKKCAGRKIDFKVADGEKIMPDVKFDLITSNASFQWFENFASAVKRFAGMLSGSGILCFSVYGPGTFKELEEVLSAHFGYYPSLSSSSFISGDEIEKLVRKYFRKLHFEEKFFTAKFFTLWDFLKDIKRSGCRGEGLRGDIFFGKHTIKELENSYKQKFGEIVVTHHVNFCLAEI